MIAHILIQTGWTDNEVKVYDAIGSKETPSLFEISNLIKKPIPTLQRVINSLVRKGVIRCYLKGDYLFHRLESPMKLAYWVQDFNHYLVNIEKIATDFSEQYDFNPALVAPHVEFFTGKRNLIKLIEKFDRSLDKGKNHRVYLVAHMDEVDKDSLFCKLAKKLYKHKECKIEGKFFVPQVSMEEPVKQMFRGVPIDFFERNTFLAKDSMILVDKDDVYIFNFDGGKGFAYSFTDKVLSGMVKESFRSISR
jgi:hypothetical protein